MRFDVLTLFPEMLQSPLEHSILKRARDAGLLEVRAYDIREYATGRHRAMAAWSPETSTGGTSSPRHTGGRV